MPQLLKKVQGEVITNTIGNVSFIFGVSGMIQQGDFINLNGFVAFLQNLNYVDELTKITSPLEFGLKNTYNIETTSLEINY